MLTIEIDDLSDSDLMPLDTPILKVSRPVAACTRCRMAKIKCDGRLPACTSCERTGRAAECTNTSDQFAKGKERSYVSTLETRIERLQEKLDDARRRKPSVISIPDDETAIPSRRESFEQLEPAEALTPGPSKAQRRQENHAIDDLVSDFGFLSVNATARDFFGFTTDMSYSRLIIWASSKDPLPEGITKALPARHITTKLLQHYLNGMHQLVPFIDQTSLYSCVNNVYHDSGRAEPFDHWMVRMMLAVACASMSERSGDQSYLEGIGHVCAALEHSEAVIQPGAISSVQALIMLVVYALLDPHHFDAWTVIGAASRAMVDLGLHQDPPKGAPMSKGKLETRRRIFWAVYVLDRSNSLVQSRAFSFSDDSTKVKVAFVKNASSNGSSPTDSREASKSWLQANEQALDLIALRQLQSGWYTMLFQSGRTAWDEPYPYIWNVCGNMKRWYDKLPTSTPPHMKTYFELELLYSYIYVLAPSPRVPTIVPYAQTLIFEHCIRYAEILLLLLNDTQSLAPLTFTDAMRAYMIGRFFLDILQQNTDGLLSGTVPPLPGVPPSASPPPSMPEVNYPPGEPPQYINTLRAIACIKRLTDCLARFGLRWGYLSWSQHYTTATAPMLEQLNSRQRDYESLASIRRGSVWHGDSQMPASSPSNMSGTHSPLSSHHNSISSQHHPSISSQHHPSISSQHHPSISSQHHPSVSSQHHPSVSSQHHPSVSSGQYLSAAPAVQSLGSYNGSSSPSSISPPAQVSPPLQNGPQLWQQQGLTGLYQTHSNQSSTGTARSPQESPFAFTDSAAGYAQATAFSTAPHSQFGNWHGYSGPTVANTLDDENAAAPPNVPWEQLQR